MKRCGFFLLGVILIGCVSASVQQITPPPNVPIMERPVLYQGEKWDFEVRQYVWGWRRNARTVFVKQVDSLNGLRVYYMRELIPSFVPDPLPWTIVRDSDLNAVAYLDPRNERVLKANVSSFSWPLFVGREWKVDGQDELRQLSFYGRAKVEKYEIVATKAGTFRAFVVEIKGRLVDQTTGHSYSFSEIYWWAPEVKNYVRYEINWGSSWFLNVNGELIDYALKDDK